MLTHPAFYTICTSQQMRRVVINMELKTLKYQVMGNGTWITATVSKIVATQLAAEYKSYGWPVEIHSIEDKAQFNRKVS